MKEWVLTRGAVLGGLILLACGPSTTDETTGTDLAAMAENNVEKALRGTHRAGSFIADSATLASSLGSLGGSESCVQEPCDSNGICPPAECTTEEVTVTDLQKSRDDLNESIDDLMKTLREKIFIKDNLESEGGGSATYLLGPKTLCSADGDSTSLSDATGGAAGKPSVPAPAPTQNSELDPSCVEQANRWQVRLRLSSAGNGNVDVALLLTSSKLNPVTLELYQDHVGLAVDLFDLKKTLDAMKEDTGSLDSLDGKVEFELKRNADLDYSFLVNVLEDVKLGLHDDGGEVVHYGIGHSSPTFEVRFDGNARKVTGSLDLGAITVDGSLNLFRDMYDPATTDEFGDPVPRPVVAGNVTALLAGLEGGVTFDGSTDKLSLTHLGLGDQTSTVKVDQDTIASLDLNPDSGRHFDLSLEKQAKGTLATFVPTLEVREMLNFAPLAARIQNISPSLLNNGIHFWFDGQNPSVSVETDQLRVVSGTFNYTQSYDPSGDIHASAGSCVRDAATVVSTDAPSSGPVVATCQ